MKSADSVEFKNLVEALGSKADDIESDDQLPYLTYKESLIASGLAKTNYKAIHKTQWQVTALFWLLIANLLATLFWR